TGNCRNHPGRIYFAYAVIACICKINITGSVPGDTQATKRGTGGGHPITGKIRGAVTAYCTNDPRSVYFTYPLIAAITEIDITRTIGYYTPRTGNHRSSSRKTVSAKTGSTITRNSCNDTHLINFAEPVRISNEKILRSVCINM